MTPIVLWHPDSPGMKVSVVRSWWQKTIYPKDFATIDETLKYYAYQKAFEMLHKGG